MKAAACMNGGVWSPLQLRREGNSIERRVSMLRIPLLFGNHARFMRQDEKTVFSAALTDRLQSWAGLLVMNPDGSNDRRCARVGSWMNSSSLVWALKSTPYEILRIHLNIFRQSRVSAWQGELFTSLVETLIEERHCFVWLYDAAREAWIQNVSTFY